MRKIDFIIIHHSAFSEKKQDSFEYVDTYHRKVKEFRKIGYHYFITKDGIAHIGRDLDEIGAHCEGFNPVSIGICLSGNFEEEKPTKAQINTLIPLLEKLSEKYPYAKVRPHKHYKNTLCPGKNLINALSDLWS